MGAEELWNQCGNKVAMVTSQLLQTPVCVYVKEKEKEKEGGGGKRGDGWLADVVKS